ncbi:hypothetical protein MRB53_006901 [Persea americana]|uniref:Uncharacterized protein n=1 Tax=Persea americana TaxID=3435 RepID=A0ACC2MHZ3_PERAE|nr:hypothetical protein MRB53_006901 [Persea americana]
MVRRFLEQNKVVLSFSLKRWSLPPSHFPLQAPSQVKELKQEESKADLLLNGAVFQPFKLKGEEKTHLRLPEVYERPARPRYLVVLGDDPETKEERGKNLLNKRPKTLFKYYANGSRWWDCDMEGVDSEEVGYVNT